MAALSGANAPNPERRPVLPPTESGKLGDTPASLFQTTSDREPPKGHLETSTDPVLNLVLTLVGGLNKAWALSGLCLGSPLVVSCKGTDEAKPLEYSGALY